MIYIRGLMVLTEVDFTLHFELTKATPYLAFMESYGMAIVDMLEKIDHVIIPHASTKLKGGYTGITLSVCPSVDRIVSALYLQQYSSDTFHICTSYQAT